MARILLAEDDDSVRIFLARALRRAGHEVCDMPDGRQALAWVSEHPVDLLLADVVMPGKLDGLGLARAFIERQPGGKVLLTSGFPGTRLTDVEGLSTTLRLLSKPYRKRDLARMLHETIADQSPADVEVSLSRC